MLCEVMELSGIGLFVLSRNCIAAVNWLFAAGMLTVGGDDAAWFAFIQSSGAFSLVLWQRIIVAANVVMLPTPKSRKLSAKGLNGLILWRS